jgi:hypothetical protein
MAGPLLWISTFHALGSARPTLGFQHACHSSREHRAKPNQGTSTVRSRICSRGLMFRNTHRAHCALFAPMAVGLGCFAAQHESNNDGRKRFISTSRQAGRQCLHDIYLFDFMPAKPLPSRRIHHLAFLANLHFIDIGPSYSSHS